MRFIADGPSIPDNLLLARDQGRVIFFCGAGVSRARANLPDFFGLAKKVIASLGVSEDSPACKLIREAETIDMRIGLSGVISADRVFGLLERDFLPRDIEAAVATALKPSADRDLSAHKLLLDLATTQEGIVRLVTTNFDRLFDDCDRHLPAWQPPRLPDPSRPNEFNGIVYLHGRAKSDYDGAEKDGFVLSSSEFGRAYLSDGWATSFFREIIQRYVVVFVGYTADDPPVQYLLEALNKASGKLDNVYAFQSGGVNDAASRWRHKGVEAIAYDSADGHSALWQTLAAWAERARNPDRWYSAVIELSKGGPDILAPHERGQVAHIVSTYEGAKRFSEGDEPPCAEWLCVFDPARRFAKPGYQGSMLERGPYIDPFDLYGLDSDVPPNKINPDDHTPKREIATGSWDAFALNRLDWALLNENNLPSLRGHWATHSPRLAPRLHQLGIWIAKVSSNPAAIWWAAHQAPLHPDIRDLIRWEVEKSTRVSAPEIRRAWRFLFEAWDSFKGAFPGELFELKALIAKDGWDGAMLRQYVELRRPILKVEPNYWGGPKPPSESSSSSIRDLFSKDVAYPDQSEAMSIPDGWVAAMTAGLRGNLEHALALETEVGGYGLTDISPILADDHGESYGQAHGLSAAVIEFTSLFSRLASLDAANARHEFNSWPTTDDTIFARLRIWAAGNAKVISPTDFGDVIDSISDDAFWDSRHQRDFLLVLSGRWSDLSEAARDSIERRLLSGPARWEDEENDHFQERKASDTLTRIHWLSKSGCKFGFNLGSITEALRSRAPKWDAEYADAAAESLEGRSGFVETRTDYDALLKEPLSSTLARAKELSGRTKDFLIESDPFAGLSAERPIRAFSALTHAAKAGDYPEWAWQTFLRPAARENDKARLVLLIASQLVRYPTEVVALLAAPISDWLVRASKILAPSYPKAFDEVLRTLIDSLRLHPIKGRSGIIRGSHEPDWTMEAINAPVGKMAQALFNDPRKDELRHSGGFLAPWLNVVEALLDLGGDMRRHAIVLFFHNLNWFYTIDPSWTEKKLLIVFSGDNEYDQDAAWAGFLWGARVPNQRLYSRLKPDLLSFAKQPLPSRRGYGEVLAAIILAGWGSTSEINGERLISNQEMRGLLLKVDDNFRLRILWKLERWSTDKDDKGRWALQLPEFLQDVWPRHISAKSPAISARLCDLAFSDESRFPKVAAIVLPLLTKIDRGHVILPNLRKSKDNIVDLYPEQTLALLDAVLPDNAAIWPYGIEVNLSRIGDADSRLNLDERLISLKRRWDAR
ncbi:SIR2 family protein [Reyranella sp.]|uniref:SIR2 family protein n=1 Tax=Reyranella sp. TaxID=1929291 RepID=UPI003D099070